MFYSKCKKKIYGREKSTEKQILDLLVQAKNLIIWDMWEKYDKRYGKRSTIVIDKAQKNQKYH